MYIAVVGVLASFIYATIDAVEMRARDAKRIANLNSIVHALELFKDQNFNYPMLTSSGVGNLHGWKVSYLPDFLLALEPYMPGGVPIDPLNIGPPVLTGGASHVMFNTRPDGSYFYMYHRYENPDYAASVGCLPAGTKGFIAVVGFRAVESKSFDKTKFPRAKCSGRDWGKEFDYSVLLFE
ncbi:MAG: hypothetical protein Greene041614_1033 [Parcubacteria group bacterium Greene0416_14]|nr:MAG: hypothetical protein Greene041614_1033 [Parcubacteria group bacterium Greene0416_14]